MATSPHIPLSLSRHITWIYAYNRADGMFQYHWDSLPSDITLVQGGMLSGIVEYRSIRYHVIWHRGEHKITPL